MGKETRFLASLDFSPVDTAADCMPCSVQGAFSPEHLRQLLVENLNYLQFPFGKPMRPSILYRLGCKVAMAHGLHDHRRDVLPVG